jgi:hypothetical protein
MQKSKQNDVLHLHAIRHEKYFQCQREYRCFLVVVPLPHPLSQQPLPQQMLFSKDIELKSYYAIALTVTK